MKSIIQCHLFILKTQIHKAMPIYVLCYVCTFEKYRNTSKQAPVMEGEWQKGQGMKENNNFLNERHLLQTNSDVCQEPWGMIIVN